MSLLEISPSGSIILSLLIFSPLVGVLFLYLSPASEAGLPRLIGVISSALTFLLSLFIWRDFSSFAPGFQFVEKVSWMPTFGINYVVGIDGLSFWLVLLTTFLTLLVIIASVSISKRIRSYIACLLILETGMLGTFLALDGITFYIFWEVMLIPMYFLIGVWGGSRKIYAALKFVIYTAFGSLLMLVAIVSLSYLHQKQFGQPSFFLGDWGRLTFSVKQELLLFAAFALAFSIKIPLFPFHTWLPDAHVEAPTGGSVILAGVLLKMGLYGILRFCVPVFPIAVQTTAPIFAFLAVVGIVYGALVAWVQTDMKKLVAYSSVSHLGFCVLGYAASFAPSTGSEVYSGFERAGINGAILQMLNHGISTAALFFLVGVLYDRTHTRLIADYGGIAAKIPVFAFVFIVFTFSSIGLPLTNGFVGEFLILFSSFKYNQVFALFAVSGVVLGAIYMLSLYRRVVFGNFNVERNSDLVDLSFREKVVFAPLLCLVFVVGLYPKIFLDTIDSSTSQIMAKYHNNIQTKNVHIAAK